MLTVRSRIANIGRAITLASVCRGDSILSRKRHDDVTEGRTTVNILNTEPEAPLMIDSYSQIGFRLNNGLSILGPMAIFPKTVLSWNVEEIRDISVKSLSLFFVLEPKIDILIVGLGDRGNKLDNKVLNEIRRHGTNVETLPTDAACATFNFLNSEKRSVAGALIPPRYLTVNDNDYVITQARRKQLFQLRELGSE